MLGRDCPASVLGAAAIFGDLQFARALNQMKEVPTVAALHINAIMSPIPTRVYKPATVTPRQTSAMILSGGSLICLRVTELLRAIAQLK
jgi:hypothetical protein